MNPRQERFIAEYVKDLNATQAAIRAGYSAATARQIASRLLSLVNIADAVAEKLEAVGKKIEITAQKVLTDLESSRREAHASAQYSAAIRASELLGKHIGMFVDRSETVVTERNVIRVPDAIDSPTDWQTLHTPKPH